MNAPGMYQQVLDIIARVLPGDQVDPALDFFDAGATSLALLQIVDLVEQECAVSVSITDAFDALDIDSFAQLVRDRASMPTA